MSELTARSQRLLTRFAVAAATVLAMAGLAPAAAASPAPPSSTQSRPAPPPSDTARVWYRNSDGCPDGPAFIALLSRSSRTVSLANVGDSVDFVVTLAYASGASSGRLERQSSERTVAMRDVTASSCEEVAEVLALSLDLTLQPSAEPAGGAPVLSTDVGRQDGWEPRLGAQATLATGLARTALPGAALFVDLSEAAWSSRLSLRGARGQRDAAVRVSIGLLASRIEGCRAWTLAAVRVGPCAGLELGLVSAEGSGDTGRRDSGVWSSAEVLGRASWRLGEIVSLEVQAGLLIPFVQYRFTARTGGDVTGSAALGLEAALGVSFQL